MQAYEFYATPKNGVISLPEELQDKILATVKVIMLTGMPHESAKETGSRPTIQELFAQYPADYIEDEEIDWGEAVGDEVW